MRVQVTRGYRSYHVKLIRSHVGETKKIILLDKDEKFRRDNFMLCSGLLKLYFPEMRKLSHYKQVVEFDDRGFFKTFPKSLIGKVEA